MVDNKGRSKSSSADVTLRKVGLGMSSREVSAFGASKRGLAEMIAKVNVDLNAPEIVAVLLLERDQEIRSGIEACAAVTVFVHLLGAKSCMFCLDLGARKVNGKLRGVSFRYANPRMAETPELLVAVSESDMSHDVFFPCHDKGTQACAYHEGCGTKLELESDGVFELLVEIALRDVLTTGLISSLSELEQIEDATITIANSERCLERARQ